MRNLLLVVFLIIISKSSFSQIDFEAHINAIQKEELISELLEGERNVNKSSVDYAIAFLKENGISKKYITNRNILKKIEMVGYKDSSYLDFQGVLSSKLKIAVSLRFQKFVKAEHKISNSGRIQQKIDGKIPHGAYYRGVLPVLEIDDLQIEINGEKIVIPRNVYANYYDVALPGDQLVSKPIEVYTSEDGEYIFIYFFGGKAAGRYFTKLIFTKEKYITHITAGYFQLYRWKAMQNPHFLGF